MQLEQRRSYVRPGPARGSWRIQSCAHKHPDQSTRAADPNDEADHGANREADYSAHHCAHRPTNSAANRSSIDRTQLLRDHRWKLER